MDYRLLVDFEVLYFMETLKKSEQKKLRNRFIEIQSFPGQYSDFKEEDSNGRLVDIHVFGKYAIKFWEDSADKHLKILDVHFADKAQ